MATTKCRCLRSGFSAGFIAPGVPWRNRITIAVTSPPDPESLPGSSANAEQLVSPEWSAATAAPGALADVVVSGDADGVIAKRAPAVKTVKRANMAIPRFINNSLREEDEASSIRYQLVGRSQVRIENVPVVWTMSPTLAEEHSTQVGQHQSRLGRKDGCKEPIRECASAFRTLECVLSLAECRSCFARISHSVYMVFRYSRSDRFWSALNVVPHR